MPLCYGGGIKNLETIIKLISLGVEKVAIGTSAFTNPKIIEEASKVIGSQSIVVVLDIAKSRFRRN